MVGIDHDGNLVEQKPSTLGVEQSLTGPVDPSLVLQLSVETTFFLEPLEGCDALVTLLKRVTFISALQLQWASCRDGIHCRK